MSKSWVAHLFLDRNRSNSLVARRKSAPPIRRSRHRRQYVLAATAATSFLTAQRKNHFMTLSNLNSLFKFILNANVVKNQVKIFAFRSKPPPLGTTLVTWWAKKLLFGWRPALCWPLQFSARSDPETQSRLSSFLARVSVAFLVFDRSTVPNGEAPAPAKPVTSWRRHADGDCEHCGHG